MRYLSCLLLFGCLFFNCEKEVFSSGSDTDIFPLFVTTDVHEVTVNRSYTIDVRPSPTGDFFDNVGAIGTVSSGALGTTMVMGLFEQEGQDVAGQAVKFSLQFWPETFAEGRAASLEELTDFFADGRVFPFGEGPGNVQFNLALPSATETEEISSSAYAPDINGSVRVENIFPFFSNIPGLTEAERTAWLVRVSFNGTIGIFDEVDYLAAQADGIPYVAKATATVAGEANLVLETTWR